MRHLAPIVLLTLGLAQPMRAEVSVSLNFFVDALEPHGSWIDVHDYGYCWRPRVADDPEWRPYTRGHWAYTDAGWTWISDEEWGWATYHYGRWIRVHGRWCWVPGYEWAPAWVSWRESDDNFGWAPLPPEARWDARIGFSAWTDGYYDVGPDYYNFVPRRFFGERSLRSHYVDRRRNAALYEHSANITRIVQQNNVVNNIFVGGPDPDRIDSVGAARVHRLRLRRDTSGFQSEWREEDARGRGQRSRALSRIDGDELIVAAPKVERDAKIPPPRRVAEKFGKDAIDRGWRGVGSKEEDRLRRSVRASAEGKTPRELPARPEPPRTAWAAPSSPPSTQPAEVAREPVRPKRRVEDAPSPAASGIDTPRSPRNEARRGLPVPQARPEPPEKPVSPSSPGLKRHDDLVKGDPPARVKPRPPSAARKSTKEPMDQVPRMRESTAAPERSTVPRNASPPAPESSQRGKERARPTPPAAAPPVPPRSKPPPPSSRVRDPQKADQAGQKKTQVTPRPQPQPVAQPKGTHPATSPKKAVASDEEKRPKKH